MKLLVIGASGMIGSTVLRVLSETKEHESYGTVRTDEARRFFSAAIGEKLISGIDAENHDSLVGLLEQTRRCGSQLCRIDQA